MYCEAALEYAKEQGEPLEPMDHPSLPLMGPQGCIAPPHLRPLCTMHVCSINSLGFDPDDLEWTDRYFELRERISVAEYERLEVTP
jgi:hypothetical protein